jgi:hypothetical protein
MLLEPPQSDANQSEPVPSAVELVEEMVVPKEAKDVDQVVVSTLPRSIRLYLLTPL